MVRHISCIGEFSLLFSCLFANIIYILLVSRLFDTCPAPVDLELNSNQGIFCWCGSWSVFLFLRRRLLNFYQHGYISRSSLVIPEFFISFILNWAVLAFLKNHQFWMSLCLLIVISLFYRFLVALSRNFVTQLKNSMAATLVIMRCWNNLDAFDCPC